MIGVWRVGHAGHQTTSWSATEEREGEGEGDSNSRLKASEAALETLNTAPDDTLIDPTPTMWSRGSSQVEDVARGAKSVKWLVTL